MQKILVTGAAGQIGSVLVPVLRAQHGANNVIAAGHQTPLTHAVRNAGPCITLDVTDQSQVEAALRTHEVEGLYHLSSILSALAETNRPRAHAVNINGLSNVLEAAVACGLRQVNVPSSMISLPQTRLTTPRRSTQRHGHPRRLPSVYVPHI
jgi:nucleoside-diphosphate-sugar epimerase